MPTATMPSIQKVAPAVGAMEVRETQIPKIKPHEVLIKVRASAICGSDLHLWQWDESIRGKLMKASDSFKHGVISGHEFCGHVVEVGKDVKTIMDDPSVKLAVGDFVSAESHVVCGKCYQCLHGEKHVCVNDKIIGFDRDGCFARYIALDASCVWKNDADLPFEIAAIQEPLGNAMHAAAHFPLKDQRVVIYGLGPIGMFCAVIAVIHGAKKIIAIEASPTRIGIAKEIGVSNIIETKIIPMADEKARAEERARIVKAVKDAAGEDGPDVALEMSGHADAMVNAIKCLRRGGKLIAFGLPKIQAFTFDNYSGDVIFNGLTVQGIIGRRIYDTWYKVRDLVRNKKAQELLRKVISEVAPYEEYPRLFEKMMAGKASKCVLDWGKA
ncbi:MAG TPA: alcohol dehydrogenase catalytic domain-containing protein [Planctomycetota bacterium]|nr:alcohol dehydrogenase catalytic domain-containing protein [Planctomycetota bacterium]